MVNRWGTTHRAKATNLDNQFHQVAVPTAWFRKVPDNMSARPITEASVQVVYDNILKLGVQETRVVFFIFLEDLEAVGGSFNPNLHMGHSIVTRATFVARKKMIFSGRIHTVVDNLPGVLSSCFERLSVARATIVALLKYKELT